MRKLFFLVCNNLKTEAFYFGNCVYFHFVLCMMQGLHDHRIAHWIAQLFFSLVVGFYDYIFLTFSNIA